MVMADYVAGQVVPRSPYSLSPGIIKYAVRTAAQAVVRIYVCERCQGAHVGGWVAEADGGRLPPGQIMLEYHMLIAWHRKVTRCEPLHKTVGLSSFGRHFREEREDE